MQVLSHWFKNTCCTNYSDSYLNDVCNLPLLLRAPPLCWQEGGWVVLIRSVKLVLFLAHHHRQGWRLEIKKVIATMEICLFSRQQSWAAGRSVGVVTWRSWTGSQTRHVRSELANFFPFNYFHCCSKERMINALLKTRTLIPFVFPVELSVWMQRKTAMECTWNPCRPLCCTAVDPSWHFSAGVQEASCHWQTFSQPSATDRKPSEKGFFLPTQLLPRSRSRHLAANNHHFLWQFGYFGVIVELGDMTNFFNVLIQHSSQSSKFSSLS